MRVLCLILLWAAGADDGATAGGSPNFARPKDQPPVTEKDRRPGAIRDRREERALEEAPPPSLTQPIAPGEDLTDFFETPLDGADYETTITALADRLNRQTVAGRSPQAEREAFLQALKRSRGLSRESEALVKRLYGHMLDYLELEGRFAADRSGDVLRKAATLVTDQVDLDPNVPRERGEQIVAIMTANGQFPPASIVFGIQLLPYRPVKAPAGHRPLIFPTRPSYVDEEPRAVATLELLTPPGPVCRIDFEAARVGKLVVEQSVDGKSYREVTAVTSQVAGGVQGPLLLDPPVRARYLRITGSGETDPPMLRYVALGAYSGPGIGAVPGVATAPVMDASFKEAAWPRVAEVDGFVNGRGNEFAVHQSEIRLCHTEDTLYVAVYARDDRMDTVAAVRTGYDEPLEDEESFEVRILDATGEPLRFVVNPLGARFDARGANAAWNGEWTAVTRTYTTGWAAEIAIPYRTLGYVPRANARVPANFIRQRRNVTRETSAWVAEPGQESYGSLVFN